MANRQAWDRYGLVDMVLPRVIDDPHTNLPVAQKFVVNWQQRPVQVVVAAGDRDPAPVSGDPAGQSLFVAGASGGVRARRD